MSFADSFKLDIFNTTNDDFEARSLSLFDFQYHQCDIYRDYCQALNKRPANVKSLSEIPFLPIEFFKNHVIQSGKWKEQYIFKSSGTTHSGRSKHYVKDLQYYLQVTQKIFEEAYGPMEHLKILALLPSYQEQGESSLIAMVDAFFEKTANGSGYFLNDSSNLLKELRTNSTRKILLGVSFALLDLADKHYATPLDNVTIMETGGMKGRRKELTRMELHERLKSSFSVGEIHSEYGMTELFSQAYGINGIFKFPPWARVFVREVNDPFTYVRDGATGGVNIIDLANVDTCAFLETKDLGRQYHEEFEILGRFDNSDVRGCNLMI